MVLDQGLDWRAIWADILKRPYITIGMASFVVLVPLAVTSNTAMIRRLGGQAWQRSCTDSCISRRPPRRCTSCWSSNPGRRSRSIYAAVVAGLLLYRLLRSVLKQPRARPARA